MLAPPITEFSTLTNKVCLALDRVKYYCVFFSDELAAHIFLCVYVCNATFIDKVNGTLRQGKRYV